MKKGLLSLLAVALTVVGCQNYDDQFQSLTDQITELATTVDGLTAVRDQVTALSGLVEGLTTALQTVDDEVGALSTGLGTISSTLSDLETQLNDLQLTADQLDTMSSTLLAIEEDVHELLEANAVINQNVVVNNSATLEYVETLIAADGPSVIVNGRVEFNTTTFSPAITADQLARVNAIAAKIATVLGDGNANPNSGLKAVSATPLNFATLAFVDNNYLVTGADMDDPLLRTVSGNLDIDHGGTAGAIDYSLLTSIGGDVVIAAADAATATSVNFSNVDIVGTLGHGAPGVLVFPGATSVNLGGAIFTSLTAANATQIISTLADGSAGITIDATAGGEIHLNEMENAGNVSITGSNTTNLFMNILDTVTGTLTVVNSGEAHFPLLTAITGATDITAADVTDLSALAEISAAGVDLNTTPAAVTTALATVTGDLTWNIGVISLPEVVVAATGNINSGVATNVTVESFIAMTNLPTGTLRVEATAQQTDLAATTPATDIIITAASGADVDFTADGTAVNVTVSGTTLNDFPAASTALKTVHLTNTATNTFDAASTVVTATLAGTIFAFESEAVTLAAIHNTANYKDIPGTTTGETPITFSVINTTLIESIDLSSMNRVANVVITGNTALTEVIAPSSDDLLTAGANPSFTITGNSITGTYTNHTPAFSGDGINPATPYQEACIELPGLSTWAAYVTAISPLNAPVDVEFDYKTAAGADQFGENTVADAGQTHTGTPTNASFITADQLSLISATACE